MNLQAIKPLKVRIPDDSKRGFHYVRIGTKLFIDDIQVNFLRKTGTFSVKYPDRKLRYKSGSLSGESQKGQKFSGITQGRLCKEFSPAFVKLIAQGLGE